MENNWRNEPVSDEQWKALNAINYYLGMSLAPQTKGEASDLIDKYRAPSQAEKERRKAEKHEKEERGKVCDPIIEDMQNRRKHTQRPTPALKAERTWKRHLTGREIPIDRKKLEEVARSRGINSLADVSRAAFAELRKEGVMVGDNFISERLRRHGTIREEGVNAICAALSIPIEEIEARRAPEQKTMDLDSAAYEEKEDGEYRFNARMPKEHGEYLKQKAWLLRQSVTDTLVGVIAADMARHPEVIDSVGDDVNKALQVAKGLKDEMQLPTTITLPPVRETVEDGTFVGVPFDGEDRDDFCHCVQGTRMTMEEFFRALAREWWEDFGKDACVKELREWGVEHGK